MNQHKDTSACWPERRGEQLVLDSGGSPLVEGHDGGPDTPGPGIRVILDRVAIEAEAVRAEARVSAAEVTRGLKALGQRVADTEQRLVNLVIPRLTACESAMARLIDENGRQLQHVRELQADTRHREVVGPLLRSLVDSIRDSENTIRHAQKALQRTVVRDRIKALNLLIEHIEVVVVRLERGLAQHGVERMTVPLGDLFDPRCHKIEETTEADPPRVPGTVIKVISDGWVEARTGWVVFPVLVRVVVATASK